MLQHFKPFLAVKSAQKNFSFTLVRWLLLLGIPLAWCVLDGFELLNFFENRTVDWRFKARGEIPSPAKVVYVDVDSQSLSEIGGQPWSRMYYSRVASALINAGKAKVVGMDFVFSTAGMSESIDLKKHVEGNVEFAKFLSTSPPVVLAAAYAGREFRDINGNLSERVLPLIAKNKRPLSEIEPPEIPELERSFDPAHPQLWTPSNVGLIDTMEGGTRFVPAFAPTSIRTYFHLSVEIARLYWGLSNDAVVVSKNRADFKRPDGSLQTSMPLLHGQLVEVNWFSPWRSPENPRIGFSTVFVYAEMLASNDAAEKKAAKEFFSSQFKDAIVLIGPVDPLLQDVASTPMDDEPVPRVGVHGNLLKTIIAGEYLRRLPKLAEGVLVVGLTVLAALLATWGGTQRFWMRCVAGLLLVTYIGAAFWLFQLRNIVLPLTPLVGSIFTASFAAVAWQLMQEEKQKSRIKGMFGAYVSPQLVNRMVESREDPRLGGHDAEITAYFSDIQSFSTFSEKLGSGPLVELMNEYLTTCTDIVQAQGGTLDKYIGDAVVAMFGAPLPLPDHAYRACVATQLVHQRLAELRLKWEREGDKWPKIVSQMQSRIGLNTGMCMIGNMGSRTRFNYTMMGDNVNLAARMESGSKAWGAYSMCTESTKLACEKHGGDHVVFRALGRIVVKGRTKAVPISEIVGLRDTVTAPVREGIALFEQGLAKYYGRDWDGAIALFHRSAELESNQPGKTPGVEKNPSLVYIGISEAYKVKPPPADWDGVYVMTEK